MPKYTVEDIQKMMERHTTDHPGGALDCVMQEKRPGTYRESGSAQLGGLVTRDINGFEDEMEAKVQPPNAMAIHCDTFNNLNEGIQNLNDRLDRILARTTGHQRDDQVDRACLSSAGYNDTLGQLCGIYQVGLERYNTLLEELEQYL